MEDSKSRKSDGAATRKRRSSILKSQRPPRTPFSELEFHVATPTDAKSRRVSFSRRNGVAEFEITEATTAWKNVYEEHNQSLGSSVNDSDAKGERPVVAHLGRDTDLEFEDVEAELVDVSSLREPLGSSLSADAERTSDKSLAAPHKNYELSEFTDHKTNQLFDDDANPVMKEVTDQLNLDFSDVAPMNQFKELSIEEDFNATHISFGAVEESVSDMSITDTIRSPKVAASEIKTTDKIVSWVADKENIVVNPYVAPLPSENFAVAEDCDDVLVFDGKKCKFQSDLKMENLPDPGDVQIPVTENKRSIIVYNDDAGDISVTQAVAAQIILPAQDLNSTSRKMSTTVYGNESNISMTQAVPCNIILSDQQEIKREKQETIYFNDSVDMTVTEAVPSNVFVESEERRKTIVYQNDEGQVSMTEAVPANIIMPEATVRRKTIVYENDECDISMTQAVPVNILQTNHLVPDKRKTIVYEADAAELEFTQAIPENVLLANSSAKRKTILDQQEPDKRKTIVSVAAAEFELTQAIPENVLLANTSMKRKTILNQQDSDKGRTIVYEADGAELELTQSITENLVLANSSVKRKTILNQQDSDKRKTIVYEADAAELELTQAIPENVLLPNSSSMERKTMLNQQDSDKGRTIVYEADWAELELTQSIPENLLLANTKRKTILFSNDDGNMSVTQAVPANVLPLCENHPDKQINNATCENNADHIPFDLSNVRDLSLHELQGRVKEMQESIVADVTRLCSEALSASQNVTEATSKRRTLVFHDDRRDISITQTLPANILDPEPPVFDTKKSIIYEDTAGDISITRAVPVVLVNKSGIVEEVILRNEAAVDCNVSVPAPPVGNCAKGTDLHKDEPTSPHPHTHPGINVDDSVAGTVPEEYQDHADKSITQATSNISNKNITISNNDLCNPIPAQMISIENDIAEKLNDDKSNALQNEMYPAPFDLSVPGPQNVIVYDAAIKLDKTDGEVTELNIAESLSGRVRLETSGSNTSTAHKGNPDTMDEDENTSTSAESIVVIRDDAVIKQLNDDDVPMIDQTSILNDLLDMSNASMEVETEDKTATGKGRSEPSSGDISIGKNASSESYLIIKDSDSEPVDVQTSETRKSAVTNTTLPAEVENQKSHSILGELQQKLGHLKSFINIKSPKSKHIKCLNLQNISEQEKPVETDARPNANKTASNADDTNALLDMISHFTDTRRASKDFTSEDNVEVAPIEFNGHIAIEDKSGSAPVRRSVAPDRKSMVLSREDLIKDISMAQAMLQLEESTEESDGSPEPESTPARVVKTLKFEDDEPSRREDTPLKKTAFGETTYMHDSKTRVIPEYLSYTSDLKDLMDDLVKPMVDATPQKGAPAARSASTCSTQIQANILASSQIDLVQDSDSVAAPSELTSEIAEASNRAIARALQNEMLDASSDIDVQPLANRAPNRSRCASGRVIFFDHHNPLNNVLLPAIDSCEVHGYDPRVSATSLCISQLGEALEVKEAESQHNVESRVALHRTKLPSGDATLARKPHPRSTDRGVNAATLDLKDSEVNTLIVMKKNNELLDASSSLTLVDDTVQSPFEIADSESPSPAKVPSPVEVIFKVKDESSIKLDTDLTSADDDIFLTQAKKRVYSPANREKHCTFDVTPKPAIKVQRISNSPKDRKLPHSLLKSNRAMEARDTDDITSDTSSLDTPEPRRRRASKFKTPDAALTIHHLITEYDMDSNIDQRTLTNQILDAIGKQASQSEGSESTEPEKEGSEAGKEREARSAAESSSGASVRRDGGWQPELLHEMSSKNLSAECDSSVNVVAKIDVLPFMGSSECEWEARGADLWALRLLRGRLRLRLRLAHRHDNAPRTRVRADTPVRRASVQPLPAPENDDPIASLCVQFACAAMRRHAERCSRAGDAPALLRRCAGVARVAARWARALHAARAHLACSLAADGALSLKVANIPLRSVWEVTMNIELCEEGEAPWPRAARVRVARVVSEVAVGDDEVARVLAPLPRDWGHAPRAIWKMFKHLKRKTRDDEILIL